MVDSQDSIQIGNADTMVRFRTGVSALLYHYMVEIGSILPLNIFLLVHVQFFATGLHSPLSRNQAAAKRRLRSYTVIARRKKRLKGLNEGELPVPQHVESEIVETHQLSQTGQDLPPGFHERVDRKIGQSPEFFGWNDAQVLFHNGSCEFDGLPNLRSSSDVVLNQRIDSHHPDYYQLQSVLVDIETFPSELKEVSNVSSSHWELPLLCHVVNLFAARRRG